MTRYFTSIGLGLLCVAVLPMIAQPPDSAPPNDAASPTTKRDRTNSAQQSDGERKFTQNCGRCHTSPEGFSPAISRTILQHMRVRASLGKQDEEDILHFLNP